MSYRFLLITFVVALLVACGGAEATPEQVEVTRIVTAEPIVNEVEVTTIVEKEVTRVVEVEVPVTVEVVQEVEVTRMQEIVVTATPTETPTPEPTAIPQQADVSAPSPAPATDVKPALLSSMTLVRNQFHEYGGIIDNAMTTGLVSCPRVIEIYDTVVASPIYDTSSSEDVVNNANAVYRRAIDVFANGARDMTQNCRDFMLTQGPSPIPFQQWGVARQQVDVAVNTIHPAIQSLGGS